MKPQTDQEILEHKRLMESKGFTYTETDQEYIAKFRYMNAPVKEKIKRGWAKTKQWLQIHPLTAIVCGLLLTMFLFLLLFATQSIKIGGQLFNGEIPNPLTLAQVTGFLFILAGGFFLLLGWFLVTFFLGYMFDDLPKQEEKKYERKQRVKQLTSSNQTGKEKNSLG